MHGHGSYQATLFDHGLGGTHWFYVTSNQMVYKMGHTADLDKRLRDPQFKGHERVVKIRCDCGLPDNHCDRERRCETFFPDERLPRSEQYGRSGRLDQFVETLVGNDKRGQAVLAWVYQVTVTRVA